MFELNIQKQHLLTPLLTVAAAVDKKQSLAILSNILLKLTDNELMLTATDLEIEMTARIPCHGQGTGAITVPAKKFVDIIRSLDDDANPTLSCQAGDVSIKAARSRFKLASLPADNFPGNTDEQIDVEFPLPRMDLMRLLQSTHFAMSQQDVRVFLNGLLLEMDSQTITAVGTDGHRMAISRIPCTASNTHLKLLLPRKGVQEVLRLLNNIDDEVVEIAIGKNYFRLISRQYTFLSKLIESRFPPYHKAIPRHQDKQVMIERDLLKRALARIVILAHEKSKAVLLHMQEGQITLIANNQEHEEAVELLEAQTEGDELKIGINAGYLLDVLNHLDSGLLRLSLLNADSSILVESMEDEHYQYIIMPMKI